MNMKVLVVVGLLGAAFLVGGGVTLGPQNSDDMRATAAVAQAGAVVSPDGAPAPGPQPTPGPKPPRSKCEYCRGTGFITHGDGHKTECTFCEPDKDGPDGPFTAKKCCVDCTCKKCNCKYPGQCLVEANGGKPVKICDEETGECRFYAAPDYEFVEQPAPTPKPVVDPTDLYRLQELKASATRCYKNKDYVMTFKYIQGIDNVLSHMGPSDVVEQYRKDATKARRNLEKKIYLLDKAAYDKFLSEFNSYQANEAKKYADAQTESCSSGNCEANQFWFREGSQNIWGRQMNSEGNCSSGSCGMSGGGCSSCN